jgi:hypothetical protein
VKGIIFNLVEDVVRANFGDDMWDDIVTESAVDGAYTSLGTYPDSELLSIVATASRLLGIDPDDVVRLVGAEGMTQLAERYPVFFDGHDGVMSFLLTLNDVIHPEVLKLYPGAVVPHFAYRRHGPNVLDLEYRSERGMCSLAEGLTLGAARWFGEQVELTQTACVHRSDPACVIRVTAEPRRE